MKQPSILALGAAAVTLIAAVQTLAWHRAVPSPAAGAGLYVPPAALSGEPDAKPGTDPRDICQRAIDAAIGEDRVTFVSNGAIIDPTKKGLIDSIALALRSCPRVGVEVAGHTDARGDANANMALSQQRAAAVVDALVARGVARDTLHARGAGATEPAVAGTGVGANSANRRITFTVLPARAGEQQP